MNNLKQIIDNNKFNILNNRSIELKYFELQKDGSHLVHLIELNHYDLRKKMIPEITDEYLKSVFNYPTNTGDIEANYFRINLINEPENYLISIVELDSFNDMFSSFKMIMVIENLLTDFIINNSHITINGNEYGFNDIINTSKLPLNYEFDNTVTIDLMGGFSATENINFTILDNFEIDDDFDEFGLSEYGDDIPTIIDGIMEKFYTRLNTKLILFGSKMKLFSELHSSMMLTNTSEIKMIEIINNQVKSETFNAIDILK